MKHGKHDGCGVAGLGRRVVSNSRDWIPKANLPSCLGTFVLSRECKIIWNMKWKQTDPEMESSELRIYRVWGKLSRC